VTNAYIEDESGRRFSNTRRRYVAENRGGGEGGGSVKNTERQFSVAGVATVRAVRVRGLIGDN